MGRSLVGPCGEPLHSDFRFPLQARKVQDGDLVTLHLEQSFRPEPGQVAGNTSRTVPSRDASSWWVRPT